jgi:hypothetical protein
MAQISVTVAAVIQHEGRFLFVEEQADDGVRINQPPATSSRTSRSSRGVRETLEETAYGLPEALVGIYRWRHPARA